MEKQLGPAPRIEVIDALIYFPVGLYLAPFGFSLI